MTTAADDEASKTAATSAPAQEAQDKEVSAAALVIQKQYRGYRTRRALEGQSLSPDAKWGDVLHSINLRKAEKSAREGEHQRDAASRWKRGGVLVGQLAGSPGSEGKSGPLGGPAEKEGDDDGKTGAVEGGPSIDPADDQLAQASDGEVKLGADVPGANEGGKIDNVHPIAGKRQIGLKLIERWTSGAEGQALSKIMEAQYWLEMVDAKHRYGSNLKHYHKVWAQSETKDNFFRWLDEGEGKRLDLDECPRERLDRERITYLNAEQRRNYIVDIKEGKLVWRRNGKLVDTSKNHKDLGNGQGIVEMGPEEIEERKRIRKQRRESRRFVKGRRKRGKGGKGKELKEESGDGSEENLDRDQDKEEEDLYSSCSSDSGVSSSGSSDDEDGGADSKARRKAEAHHYGGEASKKEKRLGLLNSKNWTDALLRKTVGSNTWIYVLNARYELYVGRKTTGQFQHSSFLYGGRVLSAGLLRVKKGVLVSLSPLSGHYRAGTAHFRYFVSSLQKSGVDLSRVTLSKSLLMLYGLEEYGKWTGGKSKAKSKATKPMEEKSKGKGVLAAVKGKVKKEEEEEEGGDEGRAKDKDAKKEKRGSAFLGLLRIGNKEKEEASHHRSSRSSVDEERGGGGGKRSSILGVIGGGGKSGASLHPAAAAIGKSERGRPRSVVSLDHRSTTPVNGSSTNGTATTTATTTAGTSTSGGPEPSISVNSITAGSSAVSPDLAALTASWDQARHPSPHRLAYAASRSSVPSSSSSAVRTGSKLNDEGASAVEGPGADMDRPRTLLERLGVLGGGKDK